MQTVSEWYCDEQLQQHATLSRDDQQKIAAALHPQTVCSKMRAWFKAGKEGDVSYDRRSQPPATIMQRHRLRSDASGVE